MNQQPKKYQYIYQPPRPPLITPKPRQRISQNNNENMINRFKGNNNNFSDINDNNHFSNNINSSINGDNNNINVYERKMNNYPNNLKKKNVMKELNKQKIKPRTTILSKNKIIGFKRKNLGLTKKLKSIVANNISNQS